MPAPSWSAFARRRFESRIPSRHLYGSRDLFSWNLKCGLRSRTRDWSSSSVGFVPGGNYSERRNVCMNVLLEAAKEQEHFCTARGWRDLLYWRTGGAALGGIPAGQRMLTSRYYTGFGGEEVYVDEWLRHYKGRRPDAREFALTYRVLLLQTASGVPVDISLGALEFEEGAIRRSVKVEVHQGLTLPFCTAEDLIVMKAFADREIDWRDIHMTIVRQPDSLNWNYVQKQLKQLAAA